MKCPNCNAPINTTDAKCEFCGSVNSRKSQSALQDILTGNVDLSKAEEEQDARNKKNLKLTKKIVITWLVLFFLIIAISITISILTAF